MFETRRKKVRFADRIENVDVNGVFSENNQPTNQPTNQPIGWLISLWLPSAEMTKSQAL